MAPVKTINDLPRFRVTEVRKSETSESGLALSGVIDRIAGVQEGWCFLLLYGKDALIGLAGDMKLLDANQGMASFDTADGPAAEVVVGSEMAYLRLWQPHHVWMVVETRWKWNRELVRAMDATAKLLDGRGVSVLEGEEVRQWIEIRRNGKEKGLARFYPVFPSGRTTLPPIGPDGVIHNGWDHAHCELCSGHVVAGQYGYVDLGEHWVCEACYDKYVARHDLSFIQ
jgi:hypothetical protein